MIPIYYTYLTLNLLQLVKAIFLEFFLGEFFFKMSDFYLSKGFRALVEITRKKKWKIYRAKVCKVLKNSHLLELNLGTRIGALITPLIKGFN